MNDTILGIIMHKYIAAVRARNSLFQEIITAHNDLGRRLEDLSEMDKQLSDITKELMPAEPKFGQSYSSKRV